jgi:hypothetical protein
MLNCAKWQLYLHCLTGHWVGLWSGSSAGIIFRHPCFAFSSQTERYQWNSGFVVTLNTSHFKCSRSPSHRPLFSLFLPTCLFFSSHSLFFRFVLLFFNILIITVLLPFHCRDRRMSDGTIAAGKLLIICGSGNGKWWWSRIQTTQCKPKIYPENSGKATIVS